ncbi:homeobox protein BarH-like 2 [Eleutherodactylus coqui]|uniref:homeobox protein BarH-like 2 n=1 Tax=Eleutherodactylus coqui TaxID=57060 RepID=UPI003462199D
MADCGEQPPGGRRPNVDKESDHQGPESSDDRSAAPHEENPESLLKETQVREKTVFTEVQLNTLEALFKKKPYLTPTERGQLANQLSLRPRSIRGWFQRRREKVRHQALNSQPDPLWVFVWDSKTPTQTHQDLQHKQKMEVTIKCVQAQKQSYLEMFPPPWPMDSYVLPQGPHSSNMVYCQNVGGPPDSCCGTEVYKRFPKCGYNPPDAFPFNLCLPNKTIEPRTSIWTPVPPVTIDLTSDDEPSTSSAPSTSQMPIAPDNADEGSSTDPASPLIDVEATDSD